MLEGTLNKHVVFEDPFSCFQRVNIVLVFVSFDFGKRHKSPIPLSD